MGGGVRTESEHHKECPTQLTTFMSFNRPSITDTGLHCFAPLAVVHEINEPSNCLRFAFGRLRNSSRDKDLTTGGEFTTAPLGP